MSMINNVFAFDIETVPDVEFGRRLHGLETLTDKQVGYVMHTRQREQTGSEFLSLEQQRIVAISIAMRSRDGFKVWSLGEPDSTEEELVRRFFDGIERLAPTLVSWNGAGFDLPVLHYRALRHRSRPTATGRWATRTRRSVEQLHQPLSLAARRPDGRARRASRAAGASASTRWRSCWASPASSA